MIPDKAPLGGCQLFLVSYKLTTALSGARFTTRERCSQRRHRYYSGDFHHARPPRSRGAAEAAASAAFCSAQAVQDPEKIESETPLGLGLCGFLRDGDCVRDGVIILQLPRNARVRVVGMFLLDLSEVAGRALPPRRCREHAAAATES